MSKRTNEAAPFRVEAPRVELLRAVTRAATAVERRNTIPILSFVNLAMGFGTLAVTGTNLDCEMRVEIEARGEGAACLPAYRLRDMLKALDVETITLAGDADGIVTLRAGDTEATFGSLPSVDQPVLGVDSLAWALTLPEGVFAYLIGGAADAMSTEETRYYLNGVCFEVKDGQAIAVATDGHRLVSRTHNLAGQNADRAPIIVPREAVRLALLLIGTGEAKIAAYLGKDGKGGAAHLEIVTGDARLRFKLIDGTFPDWRRVVPAEGGAEVAISLAALDRVLQLARANSTERGRAVKLEPCDGGLRITSDNPDFGKVATRLACEGALSVESIGMNAEYLAGMARAAARIGSKSLRLQITGPGNPIRIMPDAAIPGAMAVLMPMRV